MAAQPPDLAGETIVAVRSPSLAGEALAVGRAVVAIGFAAAIAMTATFGASTGTTSSGGQRAGRAAALPPNLAAFAELAAADQRMFRRCLEGLQEAEDVRSRTGAWPTVEELARRGIPPFAADPLDRAGYRWQRLLDGTLVNYVGVPEMDPERPTLLVIALEPDPGTPLDPTAVIDESHHKLRDGTLLHVSISTGTARTIARPIAMPSLQDGWRLVVMQPPS